MLSLCSCTDATKGTVEEIDKLNATARIANEIQREHKIESRPYYRSVEGVAQIELNVSDPELDHRSLAAVVSKLRSVQSFDGKLQVVFRRTPAGSDASTIWARYDAKTGKQLEP